LAIQAEKKRTAAFQATAAELGLEFSPLARIIHVGWVKARKPMVGLRKSTNRCAALCREAVG
jgi:hypothetical protein